MSHSEDARPDASAPDGGAGHTESTAGTGAKAAPAPATGLLHSLWVFVREVVIVVVLAVVLSLIAKTWLIQSFWIPSASMNNTLVKDDRVMVSLLTPGPFDLGRGDVVVFKDPGGWVQSNEVPVAEKTGVAGVFSSALSWVGLLPNDEGNHLIKRVIGLPGDHVQCCTADKKLIVNGTPITEPYIHPGDDQSVGQHASFDITVPQGRVWVMGDHRSDSSDSRFHDAPSNNGSNGSVPIDDIVGRAFAVVWPLNNLNWLGEPSETFGNVPAPSQTAPAKAAATTGQP